MAGAAPVAFSACEYQADGSLLSAAYAFAGTTSDGWDVTREGRAHLRLGPGYRLLRVSHCGVCSTDLARRHLPFPLPQITGHEVVAVDEHDRLVVVEINASDAARGLAPAARCAFCRHGLATHCPARLVLGIHDLPGGFGPWLLAPVAGVLAVPPAISPASATLVEPFAAALHAVRTVAPADGDRVAVLGVGRLGAVLVAALDVWRRVEHRRIEIVAVARRPAAATLARDLGADRVLDAAVATGAYDVAEVVVDATGAPDGLALAARLATREVHLKSTTGLPAAGLVHATAAVVDELTFAGFAADAVPPPTTLPATAVVLGDAVPATCDHLLAAHGLRVVRGDDAAALARGLADPGTAPFGAADVAVVSSLAAADAVIRPQAGSERGLVRARGTILFADAGLPRDGLLGAILGKRLRVTTSRCGDFAGALAALADPTARLGARLGERLVTAVVPATRLGDAFAAAADPGHVKVVATHPGALL